MPEGPNPELLQDFEQVKLFRYISENLCWSPDIDIAVAMLCRIQLLGGEAPPVPMGPDIASAPLCRRLIVPTRLIRLAMVAIAAAAEFLA